MARKPDELRKEILDLQKTYQTCNTNGIIKKEDENLDISKVNNDQVFEAVVYDGGITNIDFMMPEDERKLLEKNLDVYENVEQMQKILKIAKNNKKLSQQVRELEMIDECNDVIKSTNQIMSNPRNIQIINELIENAFEKGDLESVSKAYKNLGAVNKSMVDARQNLVKNLSGSLNKKNTKIAFKFTNDNGEEFSMGCELGD